MRRTDSLALTIAEEPRNRSLMGQTWASLIALPRPPLTRFNPACRGRRRRRSVPRRPAAHVDPGRAQCSVLPRQPRRHLPGLTRSRLGQTVVRAVALALTVLIPAPLEVRAGVLRGQPGLAGA